MQTFDLEEREVAAGAARYWWLFLITGFLWFLVSIIILRFDYTTVAAISVLFGVVALFAGVNEFFAIAGSSGWWKSFAIFATSPSPAPTAQPPRGIAAGDWPAARSLPSPTTTVFPIAGGWRVGCGRFPTRS